MLTPAGGGLVAVFQPLIRIDTLEVVAHEGLSRPSHADGALTFPDLLDLARARGRLAQLEFEAVRIAARTFVASGAPGRLLVNLSAQAILEERGNADAMIDALVSGGLDPGRVTVELTERDIVEDPSELVHAIGYLRARGARIALDDFGNGHSNFEMWNEIHPEIVKIDRYLIHGLADSAERLAIVRALRDVAETLGAELVGEGVERVEDLRMLRELGIMFAQGYLLGRPDSKPITAVPDAVREALRESSLLVPPRLRGPVTSRRTTAGHLMIEAPSLSPEHTNAVVAERFAQHPELHAIAVVRDGRPLGLINRRVFGERMTQPFARELFGRKSCTLFMHEAPLLCEAAQPLESMADILRGEDQRYLSDGFIITNEGRYLGLGTGEALVRRVSELRIEAARYANPLTFLPGNIPVTEHIAKLLKARHPFAVAYVDLDHFKPYNDQYGYFQGDEMIRLLAGILIQNADPGRDFVGHIGGDDFMLVLQSEDWETRCRCVVAEFNAQVRALFNEDDIARGGIEGEDRRGLPQFFPLTTVAVGVVYLCDYFPTQAEAIATLAARAKHEAKRSGRGFYRAPLADASVLAALGD